MRIGDEMWYKERLNAILKHEAKLSYKDKLKVFLSLTVEELAGTPLEETIRRAFPNVNEKTTLDELRLFKLWDKVLVESSMKAMELTYKLDGSMHDLAPDTDFEEIEIATEGIE
jgi:hypothetical protein